MTPDDIIFRLLRIGLETESAAHAFGGGTGGVESLSPLSIDVSFAVRQGIAAFVYDGLLTAIEEKMLSADAIARKEKMALYAHVMQVEQTHGQHERVIKRLTEFYASHGLRMMVLKGHGLSLLYTHPNHRPCGDIDIWLYGNQKRADQLLHDEKGISIDRSHHHHTIFCVGGVMVENHYDFLNQHSTASNREIEWELHAAMTAAENTDGSGWTTPPANFNALFLLRHTARHFASAEITLRHVTDWAMFVKAYSDNIDWQWLYRVAEEQNMLRFLHCLNAICIDWLGLPAELFPTMNRNKKLEERIVSDILNPLYHDKAALGKGGLKNRIYRLRRWWGQRWKHQLVYRESLLSQFLFSLRGHLTKPTA